MPAFTMEENGLATFMESDRIYASAIIVSDYSLATTIGMQKKSGGLAETGTGAGHHGSGYA